MDNLFKQQAHRIVAAFQKAREQRPSQFAASAPNDSLWKTTQVTEQDGEEASRPRLHQDEPATAPIARKAPHRRDATNPGIANELSQWLELLAEQVRRDRKNKGRMVPQIGANLIEAMAAKVLATALRPHAHPHKTQEKNKR